MLCLCFISLWSYSQIACFWCISNWEKEKTREKSVIDQKWWVPSLCEHDRCLYSGFRRHCIMDNTGFVCSGCACPTVLTKYFHHNTCVFTLYYLSRHSLICSAFLITCCILSLLGFCSYALFLNSRFTQCVKTWVIQTFSCFWQGNTFSRWSQPWRTVLLNFLKSLRKILKCNSKAPYCSLPRSKPPTRSNFYKRHDVVK